MKGKLLVLMVIAAACLPVAIFGKAGSITIPEPSGSFGATVNYTVSQPMNDQDVVYTIRLSSEPSAADPLLGIAYLISWEAATPAGISRGFNAYFNRHCYRYRDQRLLEYHYQWDSIPFLSQDGGVQLTGQFVNLLPTSLAREIRQMQSDSTYTVNILRSPDSDKIELQATRLINDLVCKEMELIIDASTGRPLQLSTLYNPGMLGEQEVIATYNYDDQPTLTATSEDALIALYPEVFERYRVSNFSVENLKGNPLPGFALPTTTRERYLHQKGDDFATPMIIAVMEPSVATVGENIATLRQTIDRLPRQTGLIMMFTSNDIDLIEQLTGRLRVGETFLISATPFARDCGINAYPTFLLCDSSGEVATVIIGNSSTLAEQLLQNAALLK